MVQVLPLFHSIATIDPVESEFKTAIFFTELLAFLDISIVPSHNPCGSMTDANKADGDFFLTITDGSLLRL